MWKETSEQEPKGINVVANIARNYGSLKHGNKSEFALKQDLMGYTENT